MFLSAFLCLNFRNICFFFNYRKCCLIHLQKLHAYYIRLRLILPVWQICSILKSNLQCLYWSLGSVFAYRKINVFLTHIIIPVTSSAGCMWNQNVPKKSSFFPLLTSFWINHFKINSFIRFNKYGKLFYPYTTSTTSHPY